MRISEDYQEQQREYHQLVPGYGTASIHLADTVAKYINHFNVHEILDYGAGKQRLKGALNKKINPWIQYYPYDPCVEGIDADPLACEMVVCVDVLEHIEPECLDDVLEHIKELMLRVGFFSIHTQPAAKFLPDGRNAHLIQENYIWWLNKLHEHEFDVRIFHAMPKGFWVVVK